MSELHSEETFSVQPERLDVAEAALPSRWSVYVIRVDLTRHEQPPGLKIGMVGSGTIGRRLTEHLRVYGPTELLDAWTLGHAAVRLDEPHAWRLVEQYEARLQFAAEFVDPRARLRRLRPDSLIFSYEWFEDDPRVLEAVERYAALPVTLPHGWSLANADHPPERLGETP